MAKRASIPIPENHQGEILRRSKEMTRLEQEQTELIAKLLLNRSEMSKKHNALWEYIYANVPGVTEGSSWNVAPSDGLIHPRKPGSDERLDDEEENNRPSKHDPRERFRRVMGFDPDDDIG